MIRPPLPTDHFKMNPPYSLVCSSGHVASDDLPSEPPLAESGARRCTKSACVSLVYSHCPECLMPISGWIDGARSLTRGKFPTPLAPRRWMEDCPHCKAPFPWAASPVWANYHRAYLDDIEVCVQTPLPYLGRAEEEYLAERARLRQAERRRRRNSRTARIAAVLDTWPRRVMAVVGAVAAVLTLLYGVNSFADLPREGRLNSTTPTSAVP